MHAKNKTNMIDLVRLVPEEVDLFKLLVLDVSEAERLVPPVREDIERDLAADGERQAVICELLAQHLHERRADTDFLINPRHTDRWTSRLKIR